MEATGSGAGSERPGSGNVVLRGVLVVGLVAGSGLALNARQGLDWEELADPLQVRWSRVLVGSVMLLLLASTARRLLRRLRRPAARPVGDGRAEPAGEPIPLRLRVLALVVVLAGLATAWYVIDAVVGQLSDPRLAPPPTGPTQPDAAPAAPEPHWPTLLGVAALLFSVAVAARLRAGRRDPPADRVDMGSGTGTDAEPDAAELSSAVAAAEAQLAGPGDARSAIVAAYTAMALHLGSGLAGRGRPASAADTPSELLERAAAAGLVGGDAAGTLTGLFREARFSRHPMGEPQRSAAEQALARVRDELAARHG